MFFSLNIVVSEMLCFPSLGRHNLPEVAQTGKAEWTSQYVSKIAVQVFLKCFLSK